MKYIFIVNPISGKQNNIGQIRGKIAESKYKDNMEVYVTKEKGDATRFVTEWASTHNEEVRFIACGGDGTLNEVANGAMKAMEAGRDRDSMSISCYPCGSGNDFVKSFGGAERFLSVDGLVEAGNKSLDILKVGDKYSINIVNFGFDTRVIEVLDSERLKHGHGGKQYYLKGVLVALVDSMKTKCEVYCDGVLMNPEGEALLCTLANGQYVGGSFHCAPRAKMDDGLVDVCLVKCVSRGKFVQCVGSYSNGTHLENPKLKSAIRYTQARNIRVEATPGFAYTLDGELVYDTHFELEIVHKAINFAVPKKVDN